MSILALNFKSLPADSPQKNSVVITLLTPSIKQKNTISAPKKHIEYIGSVMDQQLYFGDHVKYVCQEVITATFSTLIPNIGGPSGWKTIC